MKAKCSLAPWVQTKTPNSYLLVVEMKPRLRAGHLPPAPNPSCGPSTPLSGGCPHWTEAGVVSGGSATRTASLLRPQSPTLPGSHPRTVAAQNPCCRPSIQRKKCRKGERKKELSHPQLFSQVSLRRTETPFWAHCPETK